MKFSHLFKHYENSNKRYIQKICNSNLIITARYHQIILSLVFSRPFLALDSITKKNTSLLKDVGLLRRKINHDDLNDTKLADFKTFNKNETKKINIYRKISIRKIKQMFLEIKKTK